MSASNHGHSDKRGSPESPGNHLSWVCLEKLSQQSPARCYLGILTCLLAHLPHTTIWLLPELVHHRELHCKDCTSFTPASISPLKYSTCGKPHSLLTSIESDGTSGGSRDALASRGGSARYTDFVACQAVRRLDDVTLATRGNHSVLADDDVEWTDECKADMPRRTLNSLRSSGRESGA